MSKGIIPIELIVRGDAFAYSPQEIIDRVDRHWADMSEILFDHQIPFHIRVKNMVDSQGVRKADLRTKVIKEFKENDAQLLSSFIKNLNEVAEAFESSQGIIRFNQAKALNAAKDIHELITKIKTFYSQTDYDKYYAKRADAFLENTLERWESQLVIPDNGDEKHE